jgi:predicted GNAT family N-acyltransferase
MKAAIEPRSNRALTHRGTACEIQAMPPEPRVRLVSWQEASSALTSIRTQVFVHEQAVPEDEELDGRDPDCVHALAEDAAAHAIGTARLLPDGYIGRMAVLAPARGQGVGSAMLRLLMHEARTRGLREVALHAQLSARRFYESHGFRASSEEVYLDAGIEHVHMCATL